MLALMTVRGNLQVYIIQLKSLQAIIYGVRYVFDVCDNFCGYEEFLSFHLALFYGKTQFCFCIVYFRAI